MNVAIVGATGYGGIQAVNLLKKIKKYKISFLGGNKTSGSKWNDNFPFIYLDNDPYIEEISVDKISNNAEVALLCLPNGLSSTLTRKLLDRGVKVIDLSADKSITFTPLSNNFLVNVEERPFGKQSKATSALFEILSTEISSI